MKYKNILLSSLTAVVLGCFPSCGDGTEDLTPGDPYVNYFAVDPSDKSEDGNVRRNFYEENGVYLLYSDLLASYTDEYGVLREERVDFNWGGLTSDLLTTVKFELLEDEEKEGLANLVAKYFLPYINSEGGALKPYSLLLVKNLLTDVEIYGSIKPTTFFNTWRCMAIDVTDWIGADEEDAKALGRELVKSVVNRNLNSSSPQLAPFFEVGEECYDAYYISEIIPEWVDEQNMEWLYELGFMFYYPDTWDDDRYYDSFPNKKNDLNRYQDTLFNLSEEEFMETWQNYPTIILKYNLLKECIKNAGVDLNAVK